MTNRRSSGITSLSLSLVVASAVLGFLMTVQFRSTAARLPSREQSRLVTADTIAHLEKEQRNLKERLVTLRGQMTALQHSRDLASSRAGVLGADLDTQRLAAGLVALRGPGLVVTLDDSSKPMAAADDANNYIVHDYELRDVVNVLWLAGAEAISINGERLTNLSSLYCVGSTILVNDTRLSPPYEVRAIGNSADLQQATENPKNFGKFRVKVRTYGIQFRVAAGKDVTVPAYNTNVAIRVASPAAQPTRQPGRSGPAGY